jgi:hypothetical protein
MEISHCATLPMFSPASNHILEASEKDVSSAISRYFSLNFFLLYNIISFSLPPWGSD